MVKNNTAAKQDDKKVDPKSKDIKKPVKSSPVKVQAPKNGKQTNKEEEKKGN